VPVADNGVMGNCRLLGGVLDALVVVDVAVAAVLSSFGVELAASMFFSPLGMDEPLGASVSPDPDVPAALGPSMDAR